jgi:hypothetical protein
MKTCIKCHLKKQFFEFNSHRTNLDGLAGSCKACAKAYSKARYDADPKAAHARYKAWKARNPKRVKELAKQWAHANRHNWYYRHIKYKYGLSKARYLQMIADQSGHCKMCPVEHTDSVKLHVDHDHTTGLVRGLLCVDCNALLGHAHDNESILFNAIEYLRQSQKSKK